MVCQVSFLSKVARYILLISRNRVRFMPPTSPQYVEINLGLIGDSLREEIRNVLELIELPQLVRIGKTESSLNVKNLFF